MTRLEIIVVPQPWHVPKYLIVPIKRGETEVRSRDEIGFNIENPSDVVALES